MAPPLASTGTTSGSISTAMSLDWNVLDCAHVTALQIHLTLRRANGWFYLAVGASCYICLADEYITLSKDHTHTSHDIVHADDPLRLANRTRDLSCSSMMKDVPCMMHKSLHYVSTAADAQLESCLQNASLECVGMRVGQLLWQRRQDSYSMSVMSTK